MKRKYCLATILLWLLGSQTFAQTEQFYANIDDSMLGGFVGIDPVSKNDLEKRKGYRFEYSGDVLKRITFVDPFHQYGESSSYFGCASLECRWTNKNTRETTFRDATGKITKNDSGVFLERELFDEKHRVTRVINLDPQSNRILDSSGVASYSYEYGDHERISKRFDAFGKQISDASKVYVRKITFNNEFLLVTSISFDSRGNQIAAEDGVIGEKYFYDPKNNIVREDYFHEDENGNAVDSTDNSGIHSTVYQVDAFGNTLRAATYSRDGRQKSDKDGVFETLTNYDEDGYVLSELTRGTDGTPCEVKGVAETRYVYDGRKNSIDEKRLAGDGDLAVEYRRAFDDKNRVVAAESFDNEGDPVDQYDEDEGITYSKVLFAYDDSGQAHATYFSSDGEEVVPELDEERNQSRST